MIQQRLATIVMFDFGDRLRDRSKRDTEELKTMILQSYGTQWRERLDAVVGKSNPNDTYNDLAQAKRVADVNLTALATVFGQELVGIVQQLDVESRGSSYASEVEGVLRQYAGHVTNKAALKEAYHEYFGPNDMMRGHERLAYDITLGLIETRNTFYYYRLRWKFPNLFPTSHYGLPLTDYKAAGDDEAGSARQLQAKFCTHGLAMRTIWTTFSNNNKGAAANPYQMLMNTLDKYCSSVLLRSPYEQKNIAASQSKLGVSYAMTLNQPQSILQSEITGQSVSAVDLNAKIRRVQKCAYSNYRRKNLVHWMLMDQKGSSVVAQ
jgi:hypothetical protein